MEYPKDRVAPVENIKSIQTTIDPKADLVNYTLILHGCSVIVDEAGKPECTVIFPEGTTRQELWPRTMHARFRIRLPSGLELREIDSRRERTSLYIVIDNPQEKPNEE